MGKFAGAEWVKRSLKDKPISDFGEQVANLLGDVFQGIYHIVDDLHDAELNGGTPDFPYCEIRLRHQTLSTWDFDLLTKFVVICHSRCIRMEIEGKPPKTLLLRFHKRQRTGRSDQKHPLMIEAMERIYNFYDETLDPRESALMIYWEMIKNQVARTAFEVAACDSIGASNIPGDALLAKAHNGDPQIPGFGLKETPWCENQPGNCVSDMQMNSICLPVYKTAEYPAPKVEAVVNQEDDKPESEKV